MDKDVLEAKKFNEGLVNSCRVGIEARFQTLTNEHSKHPWDWYKDLYIDCANASRIRRGLVIPPEWQRIKIAEYFKVQASIIWTIQDLLVLDETLIKFSCHEKPQECGTPTPASQSKENEEVKNENNLYFN